jgi:hypothetical protein
VHKRVLTRCSNIRPRRELTHAAHPLPQRSPRKFPSSQPVRPRSHALWGCLSVFRIRVSRRVSNRLATCCRVATWLLALSSRSSLSIQAHTRNFGRLDSSLVPRPHPLLGPLVTSTCIVIKPRLWLGWFPAFKRSTQLTRSSTTHLHPTGTV